MLLACFTKTMFYYSKMSLEDVILKSMYIFDHGKFWQYANKGSDIILCYSVAFLDVGYFFLLLECSVFLYFITS